MNNSQRSLQGVVSVDGWIAKFDKNDSATVHVDIVFRQGHFGEDSQKKIRFRICLTRAEIVLRIADGEPLRIIKQSIARTPLPDMATRETVKTTNRRAARKVKALASLTKAPSIAVGADLSGSRQVDITEKAQESLDRYLAQHFQTQNGYPCRAWQGRVRHRTADRVNCTF